MPNINQSDPQTAPSSAPGTPEHAVRQQHSDAHAQFGATFLDGGPALPPMRIARRWRRGPHQDRTVETFEVTGHRWSALQSERVALAVIASALVSALAWMGWPATDIACVLGAMGTLLAVHHVSRRPR